MGTQRDSCTSEEMMILKQAWIVLEDWWIDWEGNLKCLTRENRNLGFGKIGVQQTHTYLPTLKSEEKRDLGFCEFSVQ